MRLTAVFPQFRGLRIDHVCAEAADLTLIAATVAQSASCPLCHRRSRRVHSRFRRRVADLPCAGRAIALVIHARRFFCPTVTCPRRTFRERLPALVAPGARRSYGLRVALAEIAFALGGEPGKRLATALGMPTSSDLYADGAARGAPGAIQVADRFHLLKNLGDALERFLQQKRARLKQ